MLSILLIVVATVGVEGLTVPPEKPPVQCECPPLKHITCKEGQKLDTFKADNICGCKVQRCLWIVCPKPSHPKCKKCESLIEVDNCGCKDFECVATFPDHCPVTKVACNECQEIKQTKDDCGCQVDKCVNLSLGISQCHKCNKCQECVSVSIGPKGCGFTETTCQKKMCPKMEEKNCDFDCEYPDVVMDDCGCPKVVCKKFTSVVEPPTCSECEVVKKIVNHKCGTYDWKCERKDCRKAPRHKDICYEEQENHDKCDCPVYRRRRCQVVPAGKCPTQTAPMDGSDMCGCPHQICVPCEEMYETPDCKECELPVNVTAADGVCKQTVCVQDPECSLCSELENLNEDKKCDTCEKLVESSVKVTEEKTCSVKVCRHDDRLPGCSKCPEIKEPECKKCMKPQSFNDSNNCEVKMCVPSDDLDCFKPHPCPTPKPTICLNKCKKPTVIKANGCHVGVCTDKSAADCPKDKPTCGACQQMKTDIDECSCSVYSCVNKTCPLMSKKLLQCPEGQQQAVGKDPCGCDTPICVDKEDFCEGPNPFAAEFGDLVLRVSRGSGVDVYKAFREGGANVKTGEPEKYSDMRRHIGGGWADREAISNWKSTFANGGKIRFSMWKKTPKSHEPVVDIVFDGKGSDVDSWFVKDRVEKIVKGPDVTSGDAFQFWSMKGDVGEKVDRNFFVCVKYDGCPGDEGMIAIMEKPDVCAAWLGGTGQDNTVPRLIYSINGGACKFSDISCMSEADVVTISILA